jgi:hypothetical protein
MFKRVTFIATVLLLVSAQSFFIYAFQHGAGDAFVNLWSSFSATQTGYSQFVFRTIKWWWVLPVLCLLLAGIAVWTLKTRYVLLCLAISFIGTVALYGSAYAPLLFIRA